MIIFFIFGSLIFLTFAWLGGCWYYFSVTDDVFTIPLDIFTAISGVFLPVMVVWSIAGILIFLFFMRHMVRLQAYIGSELRSMLEFDKMMEIRKESQDIVSSVSIIRTILNNILAGIMNSMAIISPEDLSRLWRMVGSGDTEALVRDFVKRIKSTELRAMALQNDDIRSGLIRYCERYETLRYLLRKYDIYHVYGESFENSDFAKIYAIFSGISADKLLHRADDTNDEISVSVSHLSDGEKNTYFEDLLSAKEKDNENVFPKNE